MKEGRRSGVQEGASDTSDDPKTAGMPGRVLMGIRI